MTEPIIPQSFVVEIRIKISADVLSTSIELLSLVYKNWNVLFSHYFYFLPFFFLSRCLFYAIGEKIYYVEVGLWLWMFMKENYARLNNFKFSDHRSVKCRGLPNLMLPWQFVNFVYAIINESPIIIPCQLQAKLISQFTV